MFSLVQCLYVQPYDSIIEIKERAKQGRKKKRTLMQFDMESIYLESLVSAHGLVTGRPLCGRSPQKHCRLTAAEHQNKTPKQDSQRGLFLTV